MRITSETMVMRSLDRLQSRLSKYERSQSELATGRRILQPSDDPAGARRSMSLRSSLRAREQEVRNASDAIGWLGTADSQLQAATQRLQRARDLATRGATQSDPGERRALAAEIREITAELAEIANTQYTGRPLFGGFTDGPAVERQPDGTWLARGGVDRITRRLSESGTGEEAGLVRVNVTAQEWLGFAADGTGGGDLLSALERLATDIETGDQAAVSGSIATLDTGLGRIGDSLAQIGAATNRAESARARAESLALTTRTELSDVEDVDIAKGVMNLQVQEIAYEATLQAIGRALPPSLGSFLR